MSKSNQVVVLLVPDADGVYTKLHKPEMRRKWVEPAPAPTQSTKLAA